MASRSRTAQEKLSELEKGSAPFADQLVEAANFIGIKLKNVAKNFEDLSEPAAFYGRQEWLLRWLLKKLQAPKGGVPRQTPSSWKLLLHLLREIPRAKSAQMLTEKKFASITRQTLEDILNVANDSNKDNADKSEDSDSASADDTSSRSSRKRKRSGELVATRAKPPNDGLPDLLGAIFEAVNYVIRSTKGTAGAENEGQSTTFAAEYMKTALRTSAEESAKILGSWLRLSHNILRYWGGNQDTRVESWLLPFTEIWSLHDAGTEDLMEFSLHCSQYLLSLLQTVKQEDSVAPIWESELNRLIARNIMVPAKTVMAENPESDLLSTLTRISVIQDSSNATVLFEVAIQSLQPQGNQRRRPQDDLWLQNVFTVLKEAMPPSRTDQNGKAIQGMFESAINHKVGFELSILHSIASEYALPECSTNWSLLSTMIKLDANTFLIPNEEHDLLQLLLDRITAVCVEHSWLEMSSQIVSNVVVPLINECAKARDLSGFIRHWYAQLVSLESLRKEGNSKIAIFSAWEDDALQRELSKLLEPSLTVQQIVQIIDWLSLEVSENPEAVCVILEAIAGSIAGEEVIDAVGLRLYYIMFNDDKSDELGDRYKWRSWRILSRTLSWLQPAELGEIARLWKEREKPFDTLNGKIGVGGLLEVVDDNVVELKTLEFLRFGCAAYTFAPKASHLEGLAKDSMIDFFQCLARDIKTLPRDLQSAQDLGQEICGTNLNTLLRGVGWMIWSFARCVFVEYPKTLQLAGDLPGNMFKEMLQHTFWIASASSSDNEIKNGNPWLRINADAFPTLWKSTLDSAIGVNNSKITSLIIDIMLSSPTNFNNPLLKSTTNNILAIKSLLQLPSEVFSKKDRERIMTSWLPDFGGDKYGFTYESTAMHCDVLSLKVKTMLRPTFYEGVKYKDLIGLSDALAYSKAPDLKINLGLLKELVRLTLFHITANLDQARNRVYALEVLGHIQNKTKNNIGEKSKSKNKWNFATIMLFETAFTAFASKATPLNDLDIVSNDELASLIEGFKDSLLAYLQTLLQKSKKVKSLLALTCTINALSTLGVDGIKLAELAEDANSFILSLDNSQNEVAIQLANFMATHVRNTEGETSNIELSGDVTTIQGRESIREKVKALVTEASQGEKLRVLESLCGPRLTEIDGLYAARNVVIACEDARGVADDDSKADAFDVSSAFARLCSRLWRSNGYRQFCITSETLELMLRTKGRAISQWNIDSILGSISIMCSRNGPSLRPSRAGGIYLHLCHLLQAILISHRLKLQGHFHLVVQTMQALLRCLFTPLPHTNSRITKTFAPPPWLSTSHPLRATHAETFTRLLTLICDPSVSSVMRSHHNNLTSATEKAKKMAGQHMQYLLSTYIKLQLEMKMLSEVREKLVPGLYAIFDTTTPELRRAISEGLDSSGRAVFGGLYRDYARFGKWKGS